MDGASPGRRQDTMATRNHGNQKTWQPALDWLEKVLDPEGVGGKHEEEEKLRRTRRWRKLGERGGGVGGGEFLVYYWA